MPRVLTLAVALVIVGCAAQPEPAAVHPEEASDTFFIAIYEDIFEGEEEAYAFLEETAAEACEGRPFTVLASDIDVEYVREEHTNANHSQVYETVVC